MQRRISLSLSPWARRFSTYSRVVSWGFLIPEHKKVIDIKNVGYPMYRLNKVTGPASTMMACPQGKPHPEFVPVMGEGFMLSYNSKLPIVVYVPKDIEVRYRIWSASKQIKQAVTE